MRSLEDIVLVKYQVAGSVSLDWERIEEDPIWESVSVDFDLSNPEQKKQALFRYLGRYMAQDMLLDHMPSTNGPGNIIPLTMEMVEDPVGKEQAEVKSSSL